MDECIKHWDAIKRILKLLGWEEKSGIMVLRSTPRIGWKQDGTLIIGYNEYPEKITNLTRLYEIILREIKM